MSRVTRAENGARMLESVIDGDMQPPLSLLLLQKMAANTAIAGFACRRQTVRSRQMWKKMRCLMMP